MDPRFIDDLAKRLSAAVPPGVSAIRRDVEDNFKAVLQSALARLDLVSRQEFDVQAAVLRRTREKLEGLEARLSVWEKDQDYRGDAGGRRGQSKQKRARNAKEWQLECNPKIIDTTLTAATRVHRALGPGLLESVYQRALVLELRTSGFRLRTEVAVPVFYLRRRFGLWISHSTSS